MYSSYAFFFPNQKSTSLSFFLLPFLPPFLLPRLLSKNSPTFESPKVTRHQARLTAVLHPIMTCLGLAGGGSGMGANGGLTQEAIDRVASIGRMNIETIHDLVRDTRSARLLVYPRCEQ